MRHLAVLGLSIFFLLAPSVAEAVTGDAAPKYYIIFNEVETAVESPWSTTPEHLESLGLPTYTEGLRNPDEYIPLDNLSERQGMNAELANRSTHYVEYQGTTPLAL